jgi:hypothetical protein
MCPYGVQPVAQLPPRERLTADSLAGGWDAHHIGRADRGYIQAKFSIEKVLHGLGVEEEHQAGAMALVYDIRSRRFPESLPKHELTTP